MSCAGRYDRQGPDMVAFAQLEVADNSSSTHTTATQLQLVSQGKDAVIGSSLVVLVVVAQRGKKRSVQCNSFCFGDLSPTILFCAFVILILFLCCQVLLVDGEVMRTHTH